jgi:hypothetical protein
MKARAKADRESTRQQWKGRHDICLQETTPNRKKTRTCVIRHHIKAVGVEQFSDQDMQLLERLMDVIDRRNSSMLPALVYPEPLKNKIQSQIESDELVFNTIHFPKCPAEAYITLSVDEDVYKKIPMAREILASGAIRRAASLPLYSLPTFLAMVFLG